VWVPLWNPVTEDFCIEFASSLAIMLIELNAELEDFAEQIDQSSWLSWKEFFDRCSLCLVF
jgi:hypothetical protein